MAQVQVLGSNENIYDSLSRAVDKPKAFEFDKYLAREKANEAKALAEKQAISQLGKTGLRAAFNTEINKKYENFIQGVRNGDIEYNSQEYLNSAGDLQQSIVEAKAEQTNYEQNYAAWLKEPDKYLENVTREGGRTSMGYGGSNISARLNGMLDDPNGFKALQAEGKTLLESVVPNNQLSQEEVIKTGTAAFKSIAASEYAEDGKEFRNMNIQEIVNQIPEGKREGLIDGVILANSDHTHNAFELAKDKDQSLNDEGYTKWARNYWNTVIPNKESSHVKSTDAAPKSSGSGKEPKPDKVFTTERITTEAYNTDGTIQKRVDQVKVYNEKGVIDQEATKKARKSYSNKLRQITDNGGANYQPVTQTGLDVNLPSGGEGQVTGFYFNDGDNKYYLGSKKVASGTTSVNQSGKVDSDYLEKNNISTTNSTTGKKYSNNLETASEAEVLSMLRTVLDLNESEVSTFMTQINPTYGKKKDNKTSNTEESSADDAALDAKYGITPKVTEDTK